MMTLNDNTKIEFNYQIQRSLYFIDEHTLEDYISFVSKRRKVEKLEAVEDYVLEVQYPTEYLFAVERHLKLSDLNPKEQERIKIEKEIDGFFEVSEEDAKVLLELYEKAPQKIFHHKDNFNRLFTK